MTGNQATVELAEVDPNESTSEPSVQETQNPKQRGSFTDLDGRIQTEPAFRQVQITGRH